MKTIKFLLVGICLIISSCDRSTDANYALEKPHSLNEHAMMDRSDAIQTLYEQIVELDDTTEQLVVASALSPTEIYQLWLVKLDDYRATENLNIEQANFLINLENALSPKIFVENSEERNTFDFTGKTLQAQKLFGINEGWYFLNRVENLHHRIEKGSQDTSIVDGGLGDPIEACECSKNSQCSRWVGISWLGLSWENGTCSSGNCYRRGFLWWESPNNGRCKY